MCGIIGILRNSQQPPLEEKLIVRLRDVMTHRGPNDSGVWISPSKSVGLGHRRLSIIDLSESARQPMSNEDGSIWITFNGEIYNHQKLREELLKLGHIYRSQSDTETIIHAYEEWGFHAIHRIHGMFSFAIWDSKKESLWLARDRIGKKPLYFAQWNHDFVFASEIKALLAHPEASVKTSETGLWNYLTFAVAPAPWTLFDSIYKLPPATHLLIDAQKRWTFTEYWSPWQPEDSPALPAEEYASNLLRTLQTSVERRLMSDVPFGVFLSGGVDSSANVALMSRCMTRPVDTFSVGFADSAQAPYNEIQYARKIADLFKTNHHEILISDDHFFEFSDQLAWFQDEPLCDPVCFPLYYVSKLARDHGTTVIQVGEGSDELFAGYEIYRNYLRRFKNYWQPFQKIPTWMRQSIARLALPFLSSRNGVHLQRSANGEPVFLSAALAFYDLEKANLRSWLPQTPSFQWSADSYDDQNPSLKSLGHLFPKSTIHAFPAPQNGSRDFLKKMIRWECHQRLGELLLMRLDKMMMAHSTEGRAPFLDTELVELALRIPSHLKIEKGVGKAILKKAVEPILPYELIYRKKVGFCGGSGNMLTPGIFNFAKQTILKTLPSHGWKTNSLQSLVNDHQSQKAENSFQIWNLMNLSLWLKRWQS